MNSGVELFCRDERGSALLITLLSMVVLMSMSAGLVLSATVDTLITANFRRSTEALCAAQAATDRLLTDLAVNDDWTAVLDGRSPSAFFDTSPGLAPDGATLDFITLTRELQRDSDSRFGGAPARPTWRRHAASALARLIEQTDDDPRAYVVAWVADDPADPDVEPASDGNAAILLYVSAYGEAGGRRDIGVFISRASDASGQRVVRLNSWRTIP